MLVVGFDGPEGVNGRTLENDDEKIGGSENDRGAVDEVDDQDVKSLDSNPE